MQISPPGQSRQSEPSEPSVCAGPSVCPTCPINPIRPPSEPHELSSELSEPFDQSDQPAMQPRHMDAKRPRHPSPPAPNPHFLNGRIECFPFDCGSAARKADLNAEHGVTGLRIDQLEVGRCPSVPPPKCRPERPVWALQECHNLFSRVSRNEERLPMEKLGTSFRPAWLDIPMPFLLST